MRWLIALVAIMLATMGWMQYRTAQIERVLVTVKEMLMQTLVAQWQDAAGVTHTVNTPRNEGESADDHAKRHAEAVKALQALFPPVK